MTDRAHDRARERANDRRRREAHPWRALYDTAAWKRLRRAHLARDPLCARCKRDGRTTEATVVHHVERHNGDPAKFFGSELEGLCKAHHDGEAQGEEHHGFVDTIGADGWPIDPRHPVNRRDLN